jgi:hypothetical protein
MYSNRVQVPTSLTNTSVTPNRPAKSICRCAEGTLFTSNLPPGSGHTCTHTPSLRSPEGRRSFEIPRSLAQGYDGTKRVSARYDELTQFEIASSYPRREIGSLGRREDERDCHACTLAPTRVMVMHAFTVMSPCLADTEYGPLVA